MSHADKTNKTVLLFPKSLFIPFDRKDPSGGQACTVRAFRPAVHPPAKLAAAAAAAGCVKYDVRALRSTAKNYEMDNEQGYIVV